MKQICTICEKSLDLDNFRVSKLNKKKIRYQCKTCEKQQAKELRQYKMKWIHEYKLKQGCKNCGYNVNPYALQFNHRNPFEKDSSLKSERKAFKINWSLTKIKNEIEKCDVLCANCHAIHTHTHIN